MKNIIMITTKMRNMKRSMSVITVITTIITMKVKQKNME